MPSPRLQTAASRRSRRQTTAQSPSSGCRMAGLRCPP